MFRVFGIRLSLHWSFLLLLVWTGWDGWMDEGATGALASVGITLVFFVCVVLHELGHALTARRFGVNVPRILLLPIGGMAEFDRIPRRPAAEFLITIAGPLVNFAIVLALWPLVGLPPGFPWHPDPEDSFKGVVQLLLNWNLLMGCFNLLPIFPMDGGRLFRSLLAVKLPYLRATWWAARTGQLFSALLVVSLAGYLGWSWITGRDAAIAPQAYLLTLLFCFIFFAGALEYRMTARREREKHQWQQLIEGVKAVPVRSVAADNPPLSLHGPN